MRFAAAVVLLLLVCACTFLSEGTKAGYDLPSLSSLPVGDIEVAYYIISEGKFIFYIPNRLLYPGLIQTCLLLRQNKRDVICAYDTPNKPFEVFGSFTGTVAVSWHMKYAFNGTNGGSSFAREEISYSILGIDTRPKCPLRVDLISPIFGEIMAYNLSIAYEVIGNYLPQSTTVIDTSHVNFQVVGILEGHSAPMNSKEITGRSEIEPGSWFFSLTPIIDSRTKDVGSIERLEGYPNLGYIEFVFSRESIEKNRRFSVAWKEGLTDNHIVATPQKRALETDDDSKMIKQTRLCIWGTFKMDGQKNIFLKQLQYLDRTKFAFTWVAAEWPAEVAKGSDSEESKQHADLRSRLSTMSHVKVVYSPYATHAINVKQVDEHTEGGDVPLSSTFQKNESLMHEYISSRFRLSNGDIDNISPPWVKTLYTLMRTHLRDEMCDIVVYGNSRGLSSNMLITDTARALGIPTVSELLNLFVNPDTMPRAVVGPSMYSIEHERESFTKSKMTYTDNTRRSEQCTKETDEVLSVIIPPSVDIDRFDPDKIEEEDIVYHPHCTRGQRISTGDCFTIGFVARLSAEKNPGLFLQSAEKILRHNPFIRFTMVGDGDLRPYLENLASRLGISWAVHFTGWLSAEDIPRVIRGFTVLVNPSLRAWSETFCIANIEAMSMRVPLVTFAVGGILILLHSNRLQLHSIHLIKMHFFSLRCVLQVLVNTLKIRRPPRIAGHLQRTKTSQSHQMQLWSISPVQRP